MRRSARFLTSRGRAALRRGRSWSGEISRHSAPPSRRGGGAVLHLDMALLLDAPTPIAGSRSECDNSTLCSTGTGAIGERNGYAGIRATAIAGVSAVAGTSHSVRWERRDRAPLHGRWRLNCPQFVSAKRTRASRYTTDPFHSLMTSKFVVPSPNGAPARQPFVFRSLAVRRARRERCAGDRRTHRKSHIAHALKRKPGRISFYRYMRTAIGPRGGATLVEWDVAIVNSLFVLPFLAEPLLPGEFGRAPRRLGRAHF
jgi:hypothetical protein